jgi:hypothetical protein
VLDEGVVDTLEPVRRVKDVHRVGDETGDIVRSALAREHPGRDASGTGHAVGLRVFDRGERHREDTSVRGPHERGELARVRVRESFEGVTAGHMDVHL